MTDRRRLQQLGTLAGLIFDLRLSKLDAAARAKVQSEALLLSLDRPATPETEQGFVGTAAPVAALTYQRWADQRRAEINLQLARQTVEWLDARSAARDAFGRSEALRKLMVPKR